jgi:ATP-dependent RNA helicase DOB1
MKFLQGTFREDGFNTAMSMIQNTEGGGGGGRGKQRQGKGEDSACHKVIKMAMEHDLAPVIVFSFSKKDCELFALQLSKLDFNAG